MTERSKLDSPGARSRRRIHARRAVVRAALLAPPRSRPWRSRGCATAGGGSPSGSEEKPDEESQQLMEEVGGKAKGSIVWSSSRARQPRPVRDEHRRLERPPDHPRRRGRLVPALLARRERASCSPAARRAGCSSATPTPTESGTSTRSPPTASKRRRSSTTRAGGPGSRTTRSSTRARRRSFAASSATRKRRVLVDSTKVPELDGALLQQPEMSKDGRYLAITLRGSKRETGIWNVDEEDLDADRRGLPDQLDARRASDLLGPPDRQRRQPRAAHADRRTASRPKSDDDLDASPSSTSRDAGRTSTFRSCRPTATGWCGRPPSAATTTTSPTTRSTCGRWARRPRRRRV